MPFQYYGRSDPFSPRKALSVRPVDFRRIGLAYASNPVAYLTFD